MIKLKKQNKRALEEEEKKQEEDPNQPVVAKVNKKSPGELRIQKEIQELDIPRHA